MPDVMTVKEARDIIYSLSSPSKMPGFAWSIPPQHCGVGSTLVNIPNSVCSLCYALKNRYAFPDTIAAMEKRLAAMNDPRWMDAMTVMLQSQAVMSKGVFRWFDAGDLQSVRHLEMLCELARRTPDLKHWIPTREAQILKEFAKNNEVPKNVTIRLSAPMIDGAAPKWWKWTSGVHKDQPAQGRECPAPSQEGKCGDCRSCWDRSVKHVSYHAH